MRRRSASTPGTSASRRRSQVVGDYVVYTELAAIETNADFKRILEELVGHEIEDYRFWRELSREKVFRVPLLLVAAYKLVRRVLGLTFTAKLLERRETEMIRRYSSLLGGVADEKVRRGISRILEHESYHEAQLIGQVHEQKIQFLSSVILGLNDGLIELTGALVGFSFALRRTAFVALTGLERSAFPATLATSERPVARAVRQRG